MPILGRTIASRHSPMRMVGQAIKQSLPPGSQYVLIVYDGVEVVDRQVSFIASEDQDMAVARIKEFVEVLG